MSAPPVRYVPSFAACPDSESDGYEEVELDATDKSSDSSKNPIPRVCIDPQRNDTVRLSSTNPGQRELPILAYPDPPESSPSSPRTQEDSVSFKDGNILLLVRGKPFLLHEHRLEEFSVLKEKIKGARQGKASTSNRTHDILELPLDEDPTDFSNMAKILYLPPYKEVPPEDHSGLVLKSTLRLATKLGHPALQSYAIRCLDKINMAAVERIELGREFGIDSWRKEALNKLCTRDQPITRAEAEILGIEAFVELTSLREAYKLKRKSKAPASNSQDQSRGDSSGPQTPTPGTLRRSTRINAARRRIEPYRNHRAFH